jgi:hypothetical protein
MSLIVDSKIAIIMGHRTTNLFEVNRGVRQGDVISPTIFTIWINPLLEHIEKNIKDTPWKMERISLY